MSWGGVAVQGLVGRELLEEGVGQLRSTRRNARGQLPFRVTPLGQQKRKKGADGDGVSDRVLVGVEQDAFVKVVACASVRVEGEDVGSDGGEDIEVRGVGWEGGGETLDGRHGDAKSNVACTVGRGERRAE